MIFCSLNLATLFRDLMLRKKQIINPQEGLQLIITLKRCAFKIMIKIIILQNRYINVSNLRLNDKTVDKTSVR